MASKTREVVEARTSISKRVAKIIYGITFNQAPLVGTFFTGSNFLNTEKNRPSFARLKVYLESPIAPRKITAKIPIIAITIIKTAAQVYPLSWNTSTTAVFPPSLVVDKFPTPLKASAKIV